MDRRTVQGLLGVALFTAGMQQALGWGWAMMFVATVVLISAPAGERAR